MSDPGSSPPEDDESDGDGGVSAPAAARGGGASHVVSALVQRACSRVVRGQVDSFRAVETKSLPPGAIAPTGAVARSELGDGEVLSSPSALA